jgi:hypothetical protein
MKKLRCDSKWQRLPQKQREEVLNWLFDEGLGYQAALKRARKQFGVKASVSSLRRYYNHVAEERRIGELVSQGGSVADFRAAAMKILGMAAMNVAVGKHGPGEIKVLAKLIRLMLRDQYLGLRSEKLKLALGKYGVKQGHE